MKRLSSHKKISRKEFVAMEAMAQDAYLASYIAPEIVVGGSDERVLATNTTKKPYSGICYLLMEAEDGSYYRGTGNFISPNCILTAGHCVYSRFAKKYMKRIIVYPARDNDKFPFGYHDAILISAPSGWTGGQGHAYDLGMIMIEGDVGKQTGIFEVVSLDYDQLMNKYVTVAGYPGDKPDYKMWEASDIITNIFTTTVQYGDKLDTAGGQSGSGVFYLEDQNPKTPVKTVHKKVSYWKSRWAYIKRKISRYTRSTAEFLPEALMIKKYKICAVHVAGASTGNLGTRIDKKMMQFIKEFVG